jgi:hypothetical protein
MQQIASDLEESLERELRLARLLHASSGDRRHALGVERLIDYGLASSKAPRR